MSEDIVKYYRDRAREYEEVYEWRDPYRQEEQLLMETEMKQFLSGTDLIDVGCGTGYWTLRVSETVKSIIGVDINQSVLDIATTKNYQCPTEFRVMDAYKLEYPVNAFSGALASFWLSHVLKENLDNWIDQVHRILRPGARVFVSDNTYVDGISGEFVKKPGDSNTYRLRTLNDGSKHLILKNYFTAEELWELFSKHTKGVTREDVFHGKCFWWIKYTLLK
jgi:ubiquinone/menaquinone biosynthesis C-methylase UbiE